MTWIGVLMGIWQRSLLVTVIVSGCGCETRETPAEPTKQVTVAQEESSKGSKETLTEIRVVKSRSTGGDIIETHHRSDESVALEVSYRNERPVQLRAFGTDGVARWECEIDKLPKCIVRDERGSPLIESEVKRRALAAHQRLARARALLAPEDGQEHDGPEHDGHDHGAGADSRGKGHAEHGAHINVPPATEAQKRAWNEKRANAWAEAGPWFTRVDQLLEAGFPILVATTLAKEELSTGFAVTPKKGPLELPDCH